MKLTPTEEELFQKYNPDLQKRSLANKERREQEFDDFVSTIKEAAKSDKHSTSPEALYKGGESDQVSLDITQGDRGAEEEGVEVSAAEGCGGREGEAAPDEAGCRPAGTRVGLVSAQEAPILGTLHSLGFDSQVCAPRSAAR